MAVSDSIAPEAKEDLARIASADLVVALPACHTAELLGSAIALLGPPVAALVGAGKAVLLHPDTAALPEPNDASSVSSALHLLPYPLPPVEHFREQSLDQSLRSLLRVGSALQARAFVLLSFEITPDTTVDFTALAAPVLTDGYDLAIPRYPQRKFGGLINTSIVYPLVRALYGARLHFPLAHDLAISAKLAAREVSPSSSKSTALGLLTTRALCSGAQVCQVYQRHSPTPTGVDSPDVSAALSQVLNPLFQEIERTAASWQKIRGTQPTACFGKPETLQTESFTVDVHPMVDTFQRGCRDLLDIWSPILSPGTLVELRKIAKLPVDQFRLSDDLWAHVLYDFVLGFRQRVISREHLLRALTPIYLGWVASYALEVQALAPDAVDQRVEKMCLSFEKLKPYLLSRWRWPDRFTP